MSEQMQIIMILFLFAFLIGFFIAHLMRKGAYKRKYEEKLTSLGEEEKKSAYIYTQALEKEQQDHAKYNKVHGLYEAKNNRLHELRDEEATLMQQITSLEEKKGEYKEKLATADSQISEMKDEIAKLSAELDNLRELRDIVAANDKKTATLEEQLQDKKELIESYLQDIDKLKNLRKTLRLEAQKLNDDIVDLKQKLFETTQVVKAIESKYKNQLEALVRDNADLKIAALNYEYAVKEYETVPDNRPTKVKNPLIQKVFRTPDSKSTEIDNIIKKNDSNRWIDKLMKKFFAKSGAVGKEV